MHTLPVAGLIEYNNTRDIPHNETLEHVIKAAFRLCALLTIIEMCFFYCSKATGVNPEINQQTNKPHAKNKFVRGFGFCSILLTAVAVVVGVFAFKD